MKELTVEVIENGLDSIVIDKNFTKSNEYVKRLEDEQEKVLQNEIPNKDIIEDINRTDLSLDLSLVALTKALSYKLIKLENYISKIEDIIFNDDTLAELNKTQLLQLYGQSRLLRESMLKQIIEIRNKIDLDKIEAKIAGIHIKEENKEYNSLDEIIEKILEDEKFLDKAIKAQKDELNKN